MEAAMFSRKMQTMRITTLPERRHVLPNFRRLVDWVRYADLKATRKRGVIYRSFTADSPGVVLLTASFDPIDHDCRMDLGHVDNIPDSSREVRLPWEPSITEFTLTVFHRTGRL